MPFEDATGPLESITDVAGMTVGQVTRHFVLIALLFCAVTRGVAAQDDAEIRTCTLLGCPTSVANFMIQRSDGRAPVYDLTVDLDGEISTCQMPEVSEDRWTTIPCGEGVGVVVREIVNTLATQISRTTTHHEHVATGRFEAVVVLSGVAEKVTISLREGIRKTAERLFIPTYRHWYPNGPHCGESLCSAYEVTWVVP